MSQKQTVKRKLLEDGYIDNHWAIDNRLSTRLGAIIYNLRQEGMEIEGKFIDRTRNFRYTLLNRPKRIIGVEQVDKRTVRPIWG